MISSIKGTVADQEEGKVSSEQRENSFPDLDLTSTSDSNVIEEQNVSLLPSKYANTTANEVPDFASSAATRVFDVGGKASLSPKDTSFNIDSPNQLEDTSTGSTRSDDLPSFLAHTSETSGQKKEEFLSSVVTRGSDVGGKVSGKNLSHKEASLNIDSPKQLKGTDSRWSNEQPSFLAHSYETSSQKDEEYEDLKVPSLQGLTSETNDHVTKDVKSPSLAGEKAMPDKLKDTKSGVAQSGELPSFLQLSPETSLSMDEEHRDSRGSSTQASEATDSAIEDAKPPPLAGANVMNIILVAAECAPWSKTGILSFTSEGNTIYMKFLDRSLSKYIFNEEEVR